MHNKEEILSIAQKHDSFYFYDETTILDKMDHLKEYFKNVEFLYSVKANHNKALTQLIFANGFGADAASLGEVLLAHQAGLPQENIFFSAPGKTAKDIEEALDKAVIVADSLTEIQRIQDICATKNIVAIIGVRINPDFTLTDNQGVSSKFGIDKELLFGEAQSIMEMKNIRIKGIHVHVKSQELNGVLLADYYEKVFQLAIEFEEAFQTSLLFINFGSGIGVTYSPSDQPVMVPALGVAFHLTRQKYASRFFRTRLIIETGRYIVNDSGVYVTKVIDKKQSRGTTYIVLKNTLNGCVRPSIAQMMPSSAISCEPLFTAKDAFDFIAVSESPDKETVTLVGNLCTAADVIAKDIELPKLQTGDIVIITHVGSYTSVLSPQQFASQEKPSEFLLKFGRVVKDIS